MNMINLIGKCVTLQGSTNGCDVRKKKQKISHGTHNCNILVKESFGKEQLKKNSMKSFSPH